MTTDNGYLCYYKNAKWECHAPTLLAAKLAAIKHFKVSKKQEHTVGVVLAELGGKTVTHSTAEFG